MDITYILVFLLLIENQCYQMFIKADEEVWVEPHAWGHLAEWDNQLEDNNDICNKCNAPDLEKRSIRNDERVALMYFKKFIVTLFNRKKLQYDETEALYKRLLLFTLLPSQLDELEKLNDPRDLDIVLTKIFERAHTPTKFYSQHGQEMGVRSLFVDIFQDFAQLLKTSEIRFSLLAAAAIVLAWYLKSRYRIGFIVLILGGFVFYGFFDTYLECNQKLKEDQMLNFLDESPPGSMDNLPWYSRLKNFIFSIDPLIEAQKSKIKQSKKVRLYCRPDHVMLMYLNELFVNQMQYMFEKFSTSISTLQIGLTFPYNLLTPVLFLVMAGYVLRLTFKYILSPKAWLSFLYKSTFENNKQKHTESSNLDKGEDRISGENLKILLNVMHSVKSTLVPDDMSFKPLPVVSGVQEVFEQLERNSNQTSNSLLADDNSKTESPKKMKSEEVIPISEPNANISTCNVKM